MTINTRVPQRSCCSYCLDVSRVSPTTRRVDYHHAHPGGCSLLRGGMWWTLCPTLVLAAQPGWFGPDGGSGGAQQIKGCINSNGFPAPGLEFSDFEEATFSDAGVCIETASDGCLEWTASGNDMCQKAYGQACLAVVDEFCVVSACTDSLYELDIQIGAVPKAAYCNVECPTGTYYTAAAVCNLCACCLEIL